MTQPNSYAEDVAAIDGPISWSLARRRAMAQARVRAAHAAVEVAQRNLEVAQATAQRYEDELAELDKNTDGCEQV